MVDNGDEDDFCTLEHDHEDTTTMYTGLKRRLIMRWQRYLFADQQEDHLTSSVRTSQIREAAHYNWYVN
jgi:hypothetical protein